MYVGRCSGQYIWIHNIFSSSVDIIIITKTRLTLISPVGGGNTGDTFQLPAPIDIEPRRLVSIGVGTAVYAEIIVGVPIHDAVRQSIVTEGALPSVRV